MLDSLRQDVGHASRSLRRAPGFTAAAIITLALGIGANTAIFGIMDAVLLRQIPVSHPEQLYFLAHGIGDNPLLSSNYPLLERYRTLGHVFSGITAYTVQQFKISSAAGSELVDGQFVAGNYHGVLGVPFLLGRGFSAEADRPTATSLVAVISEPYWSRRFDRDPDVVGKPLIVQGKTVTIVGVTAAAFHGLRPGTRFDVTLPLALRAIDEPGFLTMHDTWMGLNMVARLRPGVSETRALNDVDAVFQQYMSEPEQAWLRRIGGRAADDFRVARLVPAGKGSGALRRQYDRSLRVLMAMVGVFLLIAAANVANLTLVQASARAREVAIRMSVGASRWRLVRQFLTESVLLAACGGAVGLLVSLWGTTAIVSLFSVRQTPVVLDMEPGGRMLMFTTALSALTGVVFGILPALRATREDAAPALKEGSASATAGPRRLAAGKTLAVCQIALCALLLAGTGLFVRTLRNLETVDAGFQKDNVLLFYLDTRGTNSRVFDLYAGLLDRLKALPGVGGVSFSTASPLATDSEGRVIEIPGLPAAAEPRGAVNNRVTPDYFPTLDISIVRGRALTAADSATAPRVAVINETMARAYFGASDPLGRGFTFWGRPDEPVTIVGVARDIRHSNLRDPAPRMIYVPLAQAEDPPALLTAAIRTESPPRSIEAAVRRTIAAYNSDLLVSYVRTMEEQMNASLVRERVLAMLSTSFGVLALLLACVGLYGVMSYGVARRTREIGIRIALGAQRAAVLREVLLDTLAVCIAGLILGLMATAAAAHLISAFLFGLSPRDPLTVLAVAAVLVVTTLVAGYLPARRAAGVDPIRALRME